MKRVLTLLAVLMVLAIPSALGAVPADSQALMFAPQANAVRISQVYGGGGNSGATYKNDFIELFNSGATAVSLSGWSVQYASATGTSWQVTNLSGSIAPGGYYLVQEAAGTGGTTNLPTPDATGSIAMSSSNGKVALVNSTTALSGGCPTTGVMDFVGYGTANCFEGSAAAPALTNTTAALRNGNGCTDTDNNAADFAVGAPNPRNSAIVAYVCPVNAPIQATCPSAIITRAGRAASGPVSASDSDGTVITATITSGGASGITLDGVTPAGSVGGTLTGTLTVNSSTALGSYNVVITFTNDDTPTPQTATCTVPVTVSDGICPAATVTGISAIQGSGTSTPILNATVTIRGRVVGDFQGSTGMNGFNVQDGGDGNVLTSDGIFVYAPSAIDVASGDAVQVTGVATEYIGVTELSSVTNVTLCGDPPAIFPTDIGLPEATNGDLERYEGMLVRLPQTLTASQNYFQGRDGQVTLSSDGRMFLPLNGNGLGDTTELNARRLIVLDDGRVGSANENPNPLPYVAADNTLRTGDTVTNLTGVIDYGPIDHNTPQTSDYRLQPTQPVTFTRVNARTAAPDPVGGNIKVASFNVLNYFTTWGCGTNCRGAEDATEFDRQRTKIIAAIQAINADVVGLMEIENNGATAVGNLVAGLNAAMGADSYAYVTEPAPGTDAIKVAMIYKPGAVTPSGAPQNYQVTTNPDYNPLFDRPPLAQAFSVVSTGEKFTVVVNHFKSKGSCPASGVDLDYGQGCWNVKRVAQATGLLDFITALQTSAGDADVLVIGDLNAYGAEDPINTLVAGGLINQVAKIPAAQRYSYVFDGQSGYLDQGLATANLNTQVSGVTIWHINADEPSVIDYNLNYKPPSPDLYTPTPYRASDHDPVIVGLNLCPVVAASTDLSITRSGLNGIALIWPAVSNAAQYQVWHDTSPYFTPTGQPAATVTEPAYPDPNATGDPTTNYYYVVTAVNACGGASDLSNRVGEFDFALTPGQ